MGSFISLLLAPLLVAIFSLLPPRLAAAVAEEEEPLPLSELLERLGEPQQQQQQQAEDLWTRILRRLQQVPAEAACYCHTVDPSPLLQCLTAPSQDEQVPVEVIRAFLGAYEDAIFSSDAQGVTPLLAAAQREMEATNVLLQANTFAAHQPDKKGRLPLHFVRADVAVAKSLVKTCPSAVTKKDQEGRLPLHYYSELKRAEAESETQSDDSRIERQLSVPVPEIARLFLQEAPPSVTDIVLQKDKKGVTPLELLYKSISYLLDKQKAHPVDDIEKLWEILTLFVQSTNTTAPATPLLHALVSLHCPAIVLKEALRRFPAQALERDAQGRTPLLVAVELLDSHSDTQAQAVVCELLQSNPRAARMTDKEGRLAIDVLTEKPYNEQVYDLIVQAEPRAIDTRDLKNKQHPFLTAAMAGNSDGVYHLLRAKPQ